MSKSINHRWIVLLVAVVIWFIIFPSDLKAVLSPVRQLLSLSQSLSIGAYLLLAVLVVCWTWKSTRTRSSN